ncbi:MAG TPA: hypothetical protein DCQ31_04375 [Bacteroidales bacterium]|nr:hypothetical protein [Bacteroidales bacterium]
MKNKIEKLTHPLFIVSLLILILNDFVLKAYYPNVITGKLSDFAGLFIFPIMILLLFKDANSKRFQIIIFTVVAISFIIWKVLPIDSFLEKINTLIPFAPSRTKDFSDLIALIVLPLSYMFNNSWYSHYWQIGYSSYLRKTLFYTVFIFSWFAISATSTIARYTIKPNTAIMKSNEKEVMLFNFERKLGENGFNVESRRSKNGKYIYLTNFHTDYSRYTIYGNAIFNVSYDSIQAQAILEEIYFSYRNITKKGARIISDSIYETRIIEMYKNNSK